MKKISCTFIKTGVRNSTRKSVTKVTEFPKTRESHVDDFGRVVDGPGVSKTHYVRTKQDRTKKDLSDYQPTGGIHTMDPSDLVELMWD